MIQFTDPFLEKKLSLNEMPAFVLQLKSLFKDWQVVLLCGSLGAGKTTLVRFLLKNLGHQALSPAFAVCHTYQGELVVHHLDLYRLKNDEDLESTGFWDIFQKGSAKRRWVLIEWADRLKWDFLPPGWHYICVRLKFSLNKNERIVTVSECVDMPV